ncbi:DUF3310 domain-containing protein [Nocardia cyriacigeorgica]|uniref:DUF3310 domain-containing protein n=1 Tax=Nocardia cyriacigeorgica TaxID=135487 RepID=UPI002453AB04|nr:DUF3310 domain-containing protein [Nocardia cyriacigeorgica]
MTDNINHPSHYADGWSNGAEVIDITENLSFNRGNAVKYLARAGKKDPDRELEDLKKARWYVEREIQRLEGPKDPTPVANVVNMFTGSVIRSVKESETFERLDQIPHNTMVRDREGDYWRRLQDGSLHVLTGHNAGFSPADEDDDDSYGPYVKVEKREPRTWLRIGHIPYGVPFEAKNHSRYVHFRRKSADQIQANSKANHLSEGGWIGAEELPRGPFVEVIPDVS